MHAQLDEARRFYQALFREPPGPFALRHPAAGAVLPPRQPIRLDWEDAVDPEPGDIVRYAITISTDSTFSAAGTLRFEETNSGLQLPDWLLPAGDRYWWRVSAIDRAGLTVPATGSPRMFDIDPVAVDTPGATAAALPARAWPNPAPRDVWFELPGDASRARIVVLDVRGRTILEGHAGAVPGLARVDAHRVRWDGTDATGRRVASGRYWVAVDAGDRRDTFPLTILN